MGISARSEYACRALVELASSYPEKRITQLKDIASAQAIPEKYLVHIMLQLKQHGLVASVRGASGGYHLCTPPSKISLGEVIRIIDGSLLSLKSTPTGVKGPGSKEGHNEFSVIWQQVNSQLSEILDNISFADILKKIQKHGKDSYQI